MTFATQQQAQPREHHQVAPTAETLLQAGTWLKLRDAVLEGRQLSYTDLPPTQEFVEVIMTLEQLADDLQRQSSEN